MKNFEFTKETLWDLRTQCCIGSLYLSDYDNKYKITRHSLYTFFEGYIEEIEYLKDDEGGIFSDYDNKDVLWNFYMCVENPFEFEQPTDEEIAWDFINENESLFDGACDCLYYGEGKSNWFRNAEKELSEQDARYLWKLAFYWMAEDDLKGAIEWKSQLK
jgi:hypothetical protein